MDDEDEYFDEDADKVNKRKKRKTKKKAASPLYKANNEGGHGNPPVKHQFQAGGPGGPGREKGSHSMASALKRVIKSRVPLKGTDKTISTQDAAAQRLLQKMLTGSMNDLLRGMKILSEFEPKVEDIDFLKNADSATITELRIWRALLERLSGESHVQGKSLRDAESEKLPGLYRITWRNDGFIGIDPIHEPKLISNEKSVGPDVG